MTFSLLDVVIEVDILHKLCSNRVVCYLSTAFDLQAEGDLGCVSYGTFKFLWPVTSWNMLTHIPFSVIAIPLRQVFFASSTSRL